jgi:hypothetical protein
MNLFRGIWKEKCLYTCGTYGMRKKGRKIDYSNPSSAVDFMYVQFVIYIPLC